MSRSGPSSGRRGRPPNPIADFKGKSRAMPIDLTTSPISVHSSLKDGDEEEDEFEEVEIPAATSASMPGTPATGTPADVGTSAGEGGYPDTDEEDDNQVIRLEIGGETEEEKAKRIAMAMRKKPITARDRAVRLEIHKLHVIALLASARIRNNWVSDELLQCRLLSLCPLRLAADLVVSPKRFPDRAQRNRLFLDALQELVTWWSHDFFDISDPLLGLRARSWDDVQEIIERMPRLSRSDILGGVFSKKVETPQKKRGKGKAMEDPILARLEEELGGERLRSVNSLAKKALQQEGSRDISAQLFVALARACGLGARLIVSIQAVPWRAEKVVPKKKGAGSRARSNALRQGMGEDYTDSQEDDLEEVPIPGVSGPDTPRSQKTNMPPGWRRNRPKDPADMYRLRQPKPPPQTVGSKPKRKKKEDMMAQPPVFWAEVYNRSDQRWVPVDPVNGIIRKKAHYEPQSDSGPVRLVYIVAFEEDGYARDVTLRYARNFAAKTCKLRPPARAGEPDWWSEITEFLQRPLRLNRDDLEDAELESSQASEGMPQHMSGFKDHPLYVLERHLKQQEVIQPKREVGRFKGEPVYRRANVLSCRTAENWMRVGRRVKERQEPMKWIKQRAVTIQKRRAQELAMQETGEAIQQGLYAENQTELYIPPPIVDGQIPRNAFGNIDLYVPTMLPAGAVHLPYKGIAKVAKKLGVSFAEATTSFEFRKQRARPVLTGIVVAADKEEEVLGAYWESNAAAEERERTKREERALKRWAKLMNGIRVRLRLRAEYGEIDDDEENENPMARAGQEPTRTAGSIIALANQQASSAWVDRVREPTPEAMPVVEENGHEGKRGGQSIAELLAAEPMEVDAGQENGHHEPDAPPVSPPPPPAPVTPRITLRIRSQAATPAAPTPPPEPKPALTRSGRPKRATANSRKVSAKIKIPAKRSTRSLKRKASEDDESEADSGDLEPTGGRNGRRNHQPPPAPSGRVLRSRVAKQQQSLREASSSEFSEEEYA
ncbi:uncharacterized protein CcaverHIS019_0311100 [Cutaneotrichosporon cavernicola]|uniref:Rad4-domain-containing protein n=1 Tax=Cutaneotrichosporon cavernicola TaxID=279322 RepID=A0AA48L319_9TREE|nr:uncharacterized protein CcaverHIS019_0311100 [Cutaneotrichosporon cavernicola]BEI91040.1 hypothetical protein CcaverHIS019_0311100 [Cutaneotrichosporon cavernicola]BEI98819.1 hypothetical protein CcaverHIS631_0311180 [Cutaneotrichosporon cavernicola]BEJ06591.1 hypothetical protein CcaverHIS641_0311130 [Cutaneotrichosporon cavernicola]